MDPSEKLAYNYLTRQGFKTIVYEPDGNIPPDFLVDGRVAVEVRRLNQHKKTGRGNRGLEEVAIPLRISVRSLLESLGPPKTGESWFVFFRFQRPKERWKVLQSKLRHHLEAFRDGQQHDRTSISVSPNFKLEIFRATNVHPSFFVFGGSSDQDSGGWLLAEMEKNLEICIEEKTRKIAVARDKYAEWWLVLIDHIGYGLDDFDRQMFRDQVRVEHDWDKVILLDPHNHKRAFEI